MTEDGGLKIAVELERLRGAMDTGFAMTHGRLDGLVQRARGTEEDVGDLKKRVASLERKIWLAAGAAAAVTGSASAGLWELFQR